MNLLRAPLSFQLTIAVVSALLLYLVLFQLNIIDFSVGELLAFYTFSVFTVTLFAVLGGVLLGMFIATRALSSQGFTPFEVSMLKLHDDVQNLKQELGELRRLLEDNELE
ncbi:MAG: hypothetical protein QF822_00660 [Candidatus Poseidoniia archaeon]|jgi:hypothetical protein|nr:hypothetical protein [Candidatus Poseidoniia archaeon]MDP6533725.1 hypothetical protein [Candidatus Poseidoniia archaeon]HIH79463.1 hypothetical protein [Candidatus Poseidoniia archaeon]|tara:strand:+ start:674 stop:1003 length:330 start_codon:yes stop_codon:yes gene_type:complete